MEDNGNRPEDGQTDDPGSNGDWPDDGQNSDDSLDYGQYSEYIAADDYAAERAEKYARFIDGADGTAGAGDAAGNTKSGKKAPKNWLVRDLKNKKLRVLYILMGLAIIAVIGFSIALGLELYTDWQSQKYYEDLTSSVETKPRDYSKMDLQYFMNMPPPSKAPEEEDDEPVASDDPGHIKVPEQLPDGVVTEWEPYVDFKELGAEYPGIAGWLLLEGTIINYPIMQWTDNNYFLSHMPDGTKHRTGALFIDYRSKGDMSGKSTLIYGHALRTGDMFGTLKEYRKQSYYEEHPIMFIYTPKKDYALVLFAGYLLDSGVEVPPMSFANEKEFTNHIADIKRRSFFKSYVEVYAEDQVVYLCTCSYDYTNARLILVGKLIEIGSAKKALTQSDNTE